MVIVGTHMMPTHSRTAPLHGPPVSQRGSLSRFHEKIVGSSEYLRPLTVLTLWVPVPKLYLFSTDALATG